MCTQKRHAGNNEHRWGLGSHHGGLCMARKFSACRKGAATPKPSESRFKYIKSTSWYVQMLCYSSSEFDGRCLLSEQSIKCRHLICLLFACLAMSASAQNTTSVYDVSSSPLPDVTQSHSWPILNDENANIPLAEKQGSTEDKNIDSSTFTSDRIALAEVDNVKNSTTKDHRKTTESSAKNENDVDKESLYFILNVFHRYSENDFLLKTDLEKLLAHIGFIPALNNSEIGVAHNGDYDSHSHDHNDGNSHDHNDGNSHNHNDDHSHDHNDDHSHDHNDGNSNNHNDGHSHDHNDRDHHHEQEDSGQDKLAEKVGHNHSSHSFDFTSVLNNASASLQEKASGRQHERDVDVTAVGSSRFGRQRRTVSTHQHEEHNQCLSTKELLQLFQYDQLDRLNVDHFWHLCPALINQLDAGFCKTEPPVTRSKDLKSGEHEHEHEHSHDGSEDAHHHHDHTDTHSHGHDHGDTSKTDLEEEPDTESVTAAVWFYAQLSVAVISLCSVAGVVVIPNMKRVFYNHTLQFLVALAVGAMSGDAMLHLLPHAMLSESHDHHHHHHHDENNTDNPHGHHGEDSSTAASHMVGMYKGLVALMGIYSFFFLERLFTLFTRNRSGKSERKQKRRRHCSGGGHEQRSKAFHMVNSKLETDGGNAPSCEEMVMIVHPNKALRAYADVSHEAYLHRCDESLAHSPPGQNVVAVTSGRDQHAVREDSSILEGFTNLGVAGWSGDQIPAAVSDAEIIGIIKDTELIATTHSHSHSHLAPDFVGPLSSVAMMIIVGDMIHNFCDGLAIGAAYAGSVAGGLSTSVAVFCHELPHEIGDFAVLVRSGLTLRKAVYFNLVSSIPCFIGAIIGLAVGNVSSTSSWLFAGVGGMFLYVTLVDLIPEMSSVYTKSGEPWFLHLLLQASGIAVGTTIMLIISVSEESLLTAFH